MSSETAKGRGRLLLLGGAALVLVGLAAYVLLGRSGDDASVGNSVTFVVREGPLTISVRESGTILAREQATLRSEVQGQARIIWLIPEGEKVERGDLLVELDSGALVDRRVDQLIRVQNNEAAFVGARENLEVVKNQARSDMNEAKLAHQFAEEDLKKYRDGDFPMEVKRAEADIALSQSERSRTQEQVLGSQRLFDEGYLTGIEFDRDKQMAEKALLELELSRSALELLHEFTYTRKMTELESDIEETDMALERAQLQASANVVQAEANFKARESEYEREQDKLAKLDLQIENTRIYAPTAGSVVYATTAQGHGWRSTQEPLEEGQMVRERQEIIQLPIASSMMAEVSVHETNLSKIHIGLGVRIGVDAVPGASFTGHVASIAPLPDARSAYMNPNLKVYKTQIYIDGDASALRTGMTCEAEIMIEHFEKTIYVPIQSVFLVRGRPTAFVVNAQNEAEERVLDTGLDNNRMIQVISGLEPGEKVLLTPPLAAATKHWETGQGRRHHGDDFVEADDSVLPSHPERTQDQTRSNRTGRSGAGVQAARGQGFQDMSPEDRLAAMEQRMKDMSAEEREAFLQRMRNRRGRDGSG